MVMMLVRKKAPRGALIRELTDEEESAVHDFFGRGRPEKRYIAETVILTMRQKDAWLQCSCVPGESPALNSAKMREDTRKLFLSGFNHEHALTCPMYREFKADGDEGATRSGTRKSPGSSRVDYRNFLPADDTDVTVRAAGTSAAVSPDRTRRKRRPRLARVLLTLLDDAGFNQVDNLHPRPTRPLVESLRLLTAVTETQEFMRGRPLSEIILLKPWMRQQALEAHMVKLEKPDSRWPAKKARVFYQIFVTDEVSRDETVYEIRGDKYHFTPEKGVSINGESQDGVRPPYLVIASYRRTSTGEVICSEAYAHAIYSRTCPVPVDSNLERQTLDSLFEVAEWLSRKQTAPSLSLKRPLFDIEVTVEGEKGYVLPDFLIQAVEPDGVRHEVVIETMGYTDEDYCERKSEQHKGMRQIGTLITDPQNWPREPDKSLSRHLFGKFQHLND
uniref:hypothetical protein n=1 Tax=Pantoea stewartii TaxID=66269 RepID=UPI003F533F80